MRALLLYCLLLVAFLAAFAPQQADAAFAYVSSSAAVTTTAGGTPDPTITFGATLAAGGLAINCGFSFGEFSASVPDDTNSNGYTAAGADVTDGSGNNGNCWFAVNGTANAPTVTQHWTGVTDNTFSYVAGFTGNAATSVLVGATSSVLSSSTSQTCGSVSATAAGQLMVGFIATTNGATSFAPANGETEILEEGTYHQTQLEYKLTAGAGAVSPQWTLGAATAGVCVTMVFALPTASGAFDVTPGVASETSTAYTIFGSLSGAGTVHAVACYAGESTPSIAQISAGHCSAGEAAKATATASPGSPPYDFSPSLTPSDSPAFPLYDLYVTDGTTRVSLTSQCLSPPAGFLFSNCPTGLTSVSDTGSLPTLFNAITFKNVPYDTASGSFHQGDMIVDSTSGAWGFIAYSSGSSPLVVDVRSGTFADNDAIADLQGGSALVNGSTSAYTQIAVGDILVVPDHVSPGGDASNCPADLPCVTIDASGQVDYTASGRQTLLNTLIYDASAHAYLTVDIDGYLNNTAPLCAHPAPVQVFTTGMAITAVDLNTFCSDADLETLHYGKISGTWPSTVTLSRNGSESGTPAAENESGVSIDVVAFDAATDTATQSLTVYPITSWTLGNYVGLQVGTALAAITALTHADFTSSLSYQTCSPLSTTGLVVSTTPAAGAELTPGSTVAMLLEQYCARNQGTLKNAHMRGVEGFGVGP